jgi:2-polyprenyl-3-methyl-5-hydroxy-6-metoxy-1,4-benzoquinol methylase
LTDKIFWKDTFEKASAKSDFYKRGSFFSESNTKILHDTIRSLVGNSKGKTILDVGCGDGSLLHQLTKTNLVVGLDHSSSMLKHAKSKGLEPLGADFDNTPFDQECFDIVVSVEALTLSDSPYESICNLMSLVAPGGKLVLSVLNSKNIIRLVVTPFFRFFVKLLPTPLDPQKVCQIIVKNGGVIEKMAITVMFPGKSIVTPVIQGSPIFWFGNNFILQAKKKKK